MILLGLLVGVYLLAWKIFSKPDHSPKIEKHPVGTPAEDVLNYWTTDKKKKTRATNMPNVPTPDGGKQPLPRPPSESHPEDHSK
jgi:hypothetical protein